MFENSFRGNVSVKIVEYFIKNGTEEQIKAMAERLCWQNNLEETLEVPIYNIITRN